MDKFLGCIKGAKDKVVEEFQRILAPLNLRMESLLRKHNVDLLKQNYLLLSSFWILIISTVMMTKSEEYSDPAKLSAGIIVLGLPISVLVLSRWTENDKINNLICGMIYSLGLMMVETLLFDTILFSNSEELCYSKIFYKMLVFALFFHSTSGLMKYQPIYIQLPLLYFQWLYLIMRMDLASTSISVTLLVKTCLILPFHNFFVYINAQGANEHFGKLTIQQNNTKELLAVIGAISNTPTYILKLTGLEEFGIKKQLEESPDLFALAFKERSLAFRRWVAALPVIVFSRTNSKASIQAREVFSFLDCLLFGQTSRFLLLDRENKQITLEDVMLNPAIDKPTRFILQEISLCNFAGQNCADIIVALVLILLEFGMRSFDFQFGIRSVSNSEDEIASDDVSVFSLDVIFLSYEGEPSLVLNLNDVSNRHAMDNLELHNESIDRALSSIAHDMRAPLHAILGYTEHLAYKISQLGLQTTEKLLDHTKKITANCEHLGALVNDILDSTRLEKGRLALNLSQFDLPTLVSECLEIAQTVSNCQNLELSYAGVDRLEVESDYYRLKRVLLNLLVNSIKLTERGTVTIECLADEEFVLIAVKDTGVGMDAKLQKMIMSTSITNIRTKKSKGNAGIGQGLANTRKLVGKLGPADKIEISSKVGHGSKFSFRIYKEASRWQHRQTDVLEKKTQFRSHQLMGHFQSQKEIMDLIGNYHEKPLRTTAAKPAGATRRWCRLSSLHSAEKNYSEKSLSCQDLGNVKFKEAQKLGMLEAPCIVESDESEIENQFNSPPVTIVKKSLKFDSEQQCFSVNAPEKKTQINVFLLEDDMFNRDILIMYLTRYFKDRDPMIPLRIDTQSSVREAIDQITAARQAGVSYDLLFTDYHLEDDLTGVDFVQRVQQICNKAKIMHPSFVLVSARSLTEKEAEPFFRSIQKPFSFDQFSNTMDKWLEGANIGGC